MHRLARGRRLTPVAPWNATGACTILDRERAVQVLHDGAWVDGWVAAQRRDPDGWWALVRYSTGPGLQYLHWRPAGELRSYRFRLTGCAGGRHSAGGWLTAFVDQLR